jgi:hypothetical protein
MKPVFTYQKYAGVGFFIVLYAEKQGVFSKRIQLVKDKFRSCKKWQKTGMYALPG